jgi:hypothetical protein
MIVTVASQATPHDITVALLMRNRLDRDSSSHKTHTIRFVRETVRAPQLGRVKCFTARIDRAQVYDEQLHA